MNKNGGFFRWIFHQKNENLKPVFKFIIVMSALGISSYACFRFYMRFSQVEENLFFLIILGIQK